jgi:hypothetical protein
MRVTDFDLTGGRACRMVADQALTASGRRRAPADGPGRVVAAAQHAVGNRLVRRQ